MDSLIFLCEEFTKLQDFLQQVDGLDSFQSVKFESE